MRNTWAPIVAALLFSAPAGAATVTLHAAHVHPEDHAWHKGFEAFSEVLRAHPDSGLELSVHPQATWGSENDYVSSLRQGLLDLAVVPPSAVGTISKNLAFLDALFLWRDREHWRRVVDGPVGERMAELIEAGTSQGDLAGLKVLGFWGGTRRHLFARPRGYTRIEDLAGLRLGVQDNAMNLEIWRSLGLAPVAVPLRSSIALINADIVEGVESDLYGAAAMKLGDVAPHATLTAHSITLRPLVMSEATWRKLTEEQQQIVLRAAAAATAAVRQLEPRQEEEALARLRAAGISVQELADVASLRARTEPLRRRLAESSGLARLLSAIEQEAGPSTR